MKAKYLFIVVLAAYNYEPAWSHIVTTSHVEQPNIPLLYCLNTLQNMMESYVCPAYGRRMPDLYRSESPVPRKIAGEAYWDHIKVCCLKPCTLPEVISLC